MGQALQSDHENKTEKIFGLVDRFLFQNLETGFCIAVLKASGKNKDVILKGALPGIAVGQKVSATGQWVRHEKFGLQFQAESFQFSLPDDKNGIEKYLASGFVKGIGPALAGRLVARFGEKTLDVLDENPKLVATVPGIGAGRATAIAQAWQRQREVSRIMVFLRAKDVPVWLASKIYSRYGDRSIEKVTSDPYSLSEEIWGVGFKTADDLAVKLGLSPEDPKRIRSAVVAVLREAMQAGDLYLAVGKLLETATEFLGFDASWYEKIEEIAQELARDGKLYIITDDENRLACLSYAYGAERSIAKRVDQVKQTKSAVKFDLKKVFDNLSTGPEKLGFPKGFELSEVQIQAVLSALTEKFCVITGGPGTGKTTLLKALCAVLKTSGAKFKLAAPTGRAAKRVSESTRFHASTIHRLLEYDPSVGKFKRNEQETLDADFLIVDEASMIDVFLANGLLKAVKHHCSIVLLGDVDQLPSVGPGNFLGDLINSEQIKTIRLNDIFRQAAGSGIVRAAHVINHGKFPTSSEVSASDFAMVKQAGPDNLRAVLEKIYTQVLPKHKINPENWIVLGPMHRGMAGCQAINSHLQEMMNPKEKSGEGIFSLGQELRVGDRVMQIRNNYDKNVFNGDMGRVKALDKGNRALSAVFGSKEVLYKTHELDQLTLAYAVSIHKSQGSEFDAVTIPIFTQHFVMLSRPLIYTAITRAKKLCLLIGQPRALAIAIKNEKSSQRTTFLKELLAGKVLDFFA